MVLALVLILLAIVVFGVGIVAEGLKWLIIIAAVLLIAGLVSGVLNRSKR